ncbi:hypothetical protein ACHRVZ_08055 [Flavobacterium sp. FlaQc-57]|uniref:hypothetical protein n=1 Tax=Flavobacterium sp. FlaQc-57 TaxID=3374186 RepID=UPI00375759A9
MQIIEKDVLTLEQKDSLMQIWNNEYPERLHLNTIEDFDLYLNGLANTKHYLLLDDSNEIKGWTFTFLRENENWFAIILDHQIQGRGNGSLLMNEIKKNNNSLNGWVIDQDNEVKQNATLYRSPMLFYVKNEFTICKEIRIENEKLSAVKINWKR